MFIIPNRVHTVYLYGDEHPRPDLDRINRQVCNQDYVTMYWNRHNYPPDPFLQDLLDREVLDVATWYYTLLVLNTFGGFYVDPYIEIVKHLRPMTLYCNVEDGGMLFAQKPPESFDPDYLSYKVLVTPHPKARAFGAAVIHYDWLLNYMSFFRQIYNACKDVYPTSYFGSQLLTKYFSDTAMQVRKKKRVARCLRRQHSPCPISGGTCFSDKYIYGVNRDEQHKFFHDHGVTS